MRKKLTAVTLAFATFASSMLVPAEALENPAEETSLEEVCDTFFRDVMESSPVNAHFSYVLPGSYEVSWDEPLGVFYESNDELLDILGRLNDGLDQIDTSVLDAKDKKVYSWLRLYADEQMAVCDLPDYTPTLSPMSGILSNLDTIITEYALMDETDIENYIRILEDVPRFLGEIEKELDYQAGLGFTPGKYVYDEFLKREEDMCATDGHVYVEAFERNLSESEIDPAIGETAIARVQAVVSDEVVPAYQDFFAEIREQAANAEPLHGLSYYDQGKDYYTALARANTGTDMTVEELTSYLEAKIDEDYTALISAYSGITNFDDLDHLTFPAATAEDALNWLKDYTDEHMPEIDLPGYTLSYLPKALQVDGNLAYYLSAPLDLTTRNIIRINGSEVADDDALTLWTTMAHEGYPGHLYQHQYFLQESLRYPAETLLGSIGTSEGWAYYVERLALDWAGIDYSQAEASFRNLSLGMGLMCRVDIGVNYEGWTNKEIQNYLLRFYGRLNKDELADFYNTCASSPGVFLPYGVGYYKTRDLFDTIRGNYISDEAMYEAYLRLGDMPFTLLEFYLGADGSL